MEVKKKKLWNGHWDIIHKKHGFYRVFLYIRFMNIIIERGEINMEEVLQYLKECKTFYLASCDGDQARVRPFGAVCQFEGKIYIITNNKKPVFEQMMKNPKIEISGMNHGPGSVFSAKLF